MEFVSSVKDLQKNIKTLDHYLQDDDHKSFAAGLIKRGTCFIAVKNDQGYSFYPSRFLGYKNNSYNAHPANKLKNGRETNLEINYILKMKPAPSEELENEYKKFCDKLGFTAWKKGSFGALHKYWEI